MRRLGQSCSYFFGKFETLFSELNQACWWFWDHLPVSRGTWLWQESRLCRRNWSEGGWLISRWCRRARRRSSITTVRGRRYWLETVHRVCAFYVNSGSRVYAWARMRAREGPRSLTHQSCCYSKRWKFCSGGLVPALGYDYYTSDLNCRADFTIVDNFKFEFCHHCDCWSKIWMPHHWAAKPVFSGTVHVRGVFVFA